MNNDWTTCKIGDICKKICSGGTPKSNEPSYYGGNIPWLNTKEINFNRIYNTEKYITSSGFDNSSAKWIDANSVIVALYGATAAKVSINTIPLTTNQACCNLTIDETVADYRYVYYYLRRNYQHLALLANGGAQQNLNAQQIKDFNIILPQLPIQHKIANILWTIDDKIELNRRINDNLEEQAKALFKSWFVDNQDNDWKKIRLEEILEIGKTSIIPAQSPDTIFEHYSLPAFDNGTRPAYEKGCAIKSSKFYIQKNMFLFSKLNPRIKRIWFPNIQTEKAICSTEFIPYKPKDASLLGFCYSIVNSEAFYEYVLSLTNGSTGSHQRFHPTATLDYSLKIPDKDIIKKFESIVRPLYELIAKNRTENEKLASLRDTLLPKLMSGKLSVEEVSFD